MRKDDSGHDAWVRSIVSPSRRPEPAAPGPARASIGFLICLSLLLMLVCLLLAAFASSRQERRAAYEKQAIAVTAVVTGFDTRTFRKGGKDIKPVVEFALPDGRQVRERLLLARLVLDQRAWVGRSLEILYLPGQPDTAIEAGAMDQLSRGTGAWLLLVLALGMTVPCVRHTISEWRRR